MIKKLLLLIAISGISMANAKSFSWFEYQNKLINNDKEKNNGSLQSYMKSKYGFAPEIKTIEQRKKDANRKSLDIGLILRENFVAEEGGEEDGSIGFLLKGKLSFEALGYPLTNSYSYTKIHQEAILTGYSYRVLDRYGVNIDANVGVAFMLDDDSSKFNTYGSLSLLYNFEGWGLGIEKVSYSKKLTTGSENVKKRTLEFLFYKKL